MASGLLARSRAVSACLCVAAASALVGCGTTSSSAVTVGGTRLTVYLSSPANLGSDPEAQDVIDAELLAFHPSCTLSSCAPIHIGRFTVALVRLTTNKLSSNARRAIIDSTAVAYLGEVVPGASADSIGITNAQDLLQVSPTDTAIALTESTPAVSGAPGSYYEATGTYGRTFARVVPNGKAEATAVVAEMKALKISSVQVQNDDSDYGRALAYAVSADARGSGLTLASSASSAGAVFYAGTPGAAAAKALDTAATANPKIKLFGSSALDDDAFVGSLSPAAQQDLYVSSPGFSSSSLSSAGQQFLTAFKSAWGHAPSSQAIFGYAAMSAVLGAVRKAGSGANNRTTVVRDLLGASNESSVLGTISIGKNGDVTIAGSPSPFVFLRVSAGKLGLPKASGGHP